MISQSDIDQILLQYDDLPMDSAVTVEITDALSGDTEKSPMRYLVIRRNTLF
jgi:hypothetical protein